MNSELLPDWLVWSPRSFPDTNLVLLTGRRPALIDSGFVGHADQTDAWVRSHTDKSRPGREHPLARRPRRRERPAPGRRRPHRGQRDRRRGTEPTGSRLLSGRVPRPAGRPLEARHVRAVRARDPDWAPGLPFSSLEALGIDLADVFEVLETEGVDKFIASWKELLDSVSKELDKHRH